MNSLQKKKPLILHICSWYPNRLNEHDGNFIHKHIRSISNVTNSFVLAVYEDENLKMVKSEIENKIEDGIQIQITYHSLSKWKFLKILRRFYYYYKGFQMIKKNVGQIDLIHAHVLMWGGVFAFLISRQSKIAYVITEHSTIYDKGGLNSFLLWILGKTGLQSRFILPVSENLAEKMNALGIQGNYQVVPNVVNTDLFSMNDQPPHQYSPFRFLHISSFGENKNIPGLLRGVKLLSETRNDFKIIIAGDGDPKYVRDWIDKAGIESGFTQLLGMLSEEEVAGLMKESDAFVLFSHSENLPCVLLEAQACGLPVISSRVGGVEEIIRTAEEGILVEKDRIDQLVSAMSRMIDDYTHFNKQRIRLHAIEEYSDEAVRKKLLEIYRMAMDRTYFTEK
jgi:glycosyltransferase involved in cell wall biosynthesis